MDFIEYIKYNNISPSSLNLKTISAEFKIIKETFFIQTTNTQNQKQYFKLQDFDFDDFKINSKQYKHIKLYFYPYLIEHDIIKKKNKIMAFYQKKMKDKENKLQFSNMIEQGEINTQVLCEKIFFNSNCYRTINNKMFEKQSISKLISLFLDSLQNYAFNDNLGLDDIILKEDIQYAEEIEIKEFIGGNNMMLNKAKDYLIYDLQNESNEKILNERKFLNHFLEHIYQKEGFKYKWFKNLTETLYFDSSNNPFKIIDLYYFVFYFDLYNAINQNKNKHAFKNIFDYNHEKNILFLINLLEQSTNKLQNPKNIKKINEVCRKKISNQMFIDWTYQNNVANNNIILKARYILLCLDDVDFFDYLLNDKRFLKKTDDLNCLVELMRCHYKMYSFKKQIKEDILFERKKHQQKHLNRLSHFKEMFLNKVGLLLNDNVNQNLAYDMSSLCHVILGFVEYFIILDSLDEDIYLMWECDLRDFTWSDNWIMDYFLSNGKNVNQFQYITHWEYELMKLSLESLMQILKNKKHFYQKTKQENPILLIDEVMSRINQVTSFLYLDLNY